ncbi:unnamed protein product, partial [Brenthis ino]
MTIGHDRICRAQYQHFYVLSETRKCNNTNFPIDWLDGLMMIVSKQKNYFWPDLGSRDLQLHLFLTFEILISSMRGRRFVVMVSLSGAVCIQMIAIVMGEPTIFLKSTGNEVISYNYPFVSRSQWHARIPKAKDPLPSPVPYVVIHHSHSPPACYDAPHCKRAMRSMQNFHMDDRGWNDIGYHFAVGGDGVAYEGRGWGVLGAHSLHFNNVSIGICLIGDWTNSVPPLQQLKTAQALIASGVELGFVKPEYKLVGHRQVRDTECPGDALYKEIQSWPHYTSFPSSYRDLDVILQEAGF